MMRIYLLLLLLVFLPEYEAHLPRFSQRRFKGPLPSGRYRISPKTGLRIALPSEFTVIEEKYTVSLFVAPEQLQWQAQELGVLIHFNLATYIEVDGCSGQMVPNASLFNPYLINTDNWVQTMLDFGAKYAVLVAKVKALLLFANFFCIMFLLFMIACLWLSYGSNQCHFSNQSFGTDYSLQL